MEGVRRLLDAGSFMVKVKEDLQAAAHHERLRRWVRYQRLERRAEVSKKRRRRGVLPGRHQAAAVGERQTTWTRAGANGAILTRCCTVLGVVTLVKCTPPASAMSVGVPTKETAPSNISKCIKEKRTDRAGYVWPRNATTMWSLLSLMRIVAELTASKGKRERRMSRRANIGFNPAPHEHHGMAARISSKTVSET